MSQKKSEKFKVFELQRLMLGAGADLQRDSILECLQEVVAEIRKGRAREGPARVYLDSRNFTVAGSDSD